MADRRIGTAGALARTAVGTALVVVGATGDLTWWDVAAALVVLPLITLAAASVVNAVLAGSAWKRRGRQPWSRHQVVVALVLIGVVVATGTAITFVSPIDGGALYLFFGGSMLLASGLGYEGCEMLALPNLVLRRTDAIWCPLYSPLDDP